MYQFHINIFLCQELYLTCQSLNTLSPEAMLALSADQISSQWLVPI